ncbi:MAG TPA: hypothetical protein VI544_01915 [Candidatus Nanoarchaeia archaeon]|nr:hypothetical protein [Candidatus Nanoarchaeia archaeon]
MRSIKELKNPDIIKINGYKFQVIKNTSLLYHTDKDKLGMVVELVKVGDKVTTPTDRLTYFNENPKEIKFFHFDNRIKKFKEVKLDSIAL